MVYERERDEPRLPRFVEIRDGSSKLEVVRIMNVVSVGNGGYDGGCHDSNSITASQDA